MCALYWACHSTSLFDRIASNTCHRGGRALECGQEGACMKPCRLSPAPFQSACIWMILLCAVSVGARAQADTEAAIKSKIVALEQLWNQAYKAGDTKALDTILDSGVVLVNDDGSVQSKAEFLASVKEMVAQPSAQQQQVAPESLNVHVFGMAAIATGVMRVKGVEGGRPYTRRERFVDTWVYKGGSWVCVGTNATPVLH